MEVVLTIAGSDSGGGAGIQADLKTFEAHGVFGISAITAVTAQNTRGVQAIHTVPAKFVKAQLESLFEDFSPKAIKIGMLSTELLIRTVSECLERAAAEIPVVLDPVMVATSGDVLLEAAAKSALVDRLFPQATVITPNIPEAEQLLQKSLPDWPTIKAELPALQKLAPEAYWLVKGGHLEADDAELARDILFKQGQEHTFEEPHIESGPLHGTGCTYSSAIAANLALGKPIVEAVKQAKEYITNAILLAPRNVGNGARPLRHQYSEYL